MNVRRVTLFLLLTALWIVGATQASAFYNPSTGRWISKDPIGERGGINLYAFVRNSPVNYFDAYGLETYSATDTIWVLPGSKAKDIGCGTLTLSTAYIDAALNNTLQLEDPATYNQVIAAVPKGASPYVTAKINLGGYLGSGFILSFSPGPNKQCCEKFKWKQLIPGTFYDSLDYQWSLASAVDFPGDTYSGFFNHDNKQGFKLQLICIDKEGKEKIKQEVSWSSRIQIDANKTPSSATVTLDLDW